MRVALNEADEIAMAFTRVSRPTISTTIACWAGSRSVRNKPVKERCNVDDPHVTLSYGDQKCQNSVDDECRYLCN